MRKAYKNIIALSVVLIAGLNFIIPAFAQDPFTSIAVGGLSGASGAGLFGSMAGMSGINIDYVSDPVNDAMWNKLNPDSVYFSGEKHEATGQGEDIYDYIDVDIGDWLSAQSDFITSFIRENNINDNDNGTTTSIQYQVGGIPLTNYASNYYNSNEIGRGTFSSKLQQNQEIIAGPIRIVFVYTGSARTFYRQYYFNGFLVDQSSNFRYQEFNNKVLSIYLRSPTPYHNAAIWTADNGNFWQASGDVLTVNSASGVAWSSSTVNENVFDNWGSAKVKIPTSISQLQSGWSVPDFLKELDRIWYGAGEDNIIIEDGTAPVPPPPVPIPDTPLGDVPFDDWVDLWGQGIWQQLDNQNDALDFLGSNGEDALEELESIDSNLEELTGTAESIDTNIGIGNGLLGGIKSGVESAVDFLEGIAEHVGELVEEIVEGTETLIAGILNQIPSVFGVIFEPIKQASSIWHYVVEWIQSISAPMSWMWAMASGTSYNIILPVYASLAGAVVLAFYKRFGK